MREKFEDLFWTIKNIFKNLRNKIYSFFTGIRNLIRWRKIIFSDRQWDFEFLYDIIHFKLKLMIEAFSSSPYTVHEKIVKQMKICQTCLNQMNGNNSAFGDCLRNIYRYNPKVNLPIEKYTTNELINDLLDNMTKNTIFSRSSFKNSKPLRCITNLDKAFYSKTFRRCIDHEQAIKKQATEMFLKYFKHSYKWWD